MLSYLPNISYLGIVAVLVFTGTGFPIPEEVPVILAGMASNPGYLSTPLNPWLALLCCVGGAMGGDCVMYAIGYHFGHGVLRDHPWFARFIRPEREQRVEQMIRKHGFKVFFIARFLVGLRSPVFLTAGILRVPFRRFIVVDAISAFAVVTTFFAFSYCFADHIVSWFKYIRGFEWTLTALVVGGCLFLLFRFWRRRTARLQRIQLKRERRARRLAIGDVEPTSAAPAETQL